MKKIWCHKQVEFVGIHNYLSQDGQKGIDVSFAYMVEQICHMPQNHSL